MTIQIIPQCSAEGLTYDEAVETDIRLRDDTISRVIDPKFMPGKYPACPMLLVKVQVTGSDADIFKDRVTETGVLTISGIQPGSYSFTIEAYMAKNVIKLSFTVFIRDPKFQIPLPTQTYLETNYTSLIYLETTLGLQVVEDRLGIVKIFEQGERANR